MRRALVERLRDVSGITMPDLMIAMVVLAVATVFAMGSMAQYREAAATSRAARVITADVALARSLAIRGREPISLVATEAQRQYVIRDTAGNLFHRRDFGTGAEIRLTSIDVATTGDSLTFDSRGVLVAGGAPQINAVRRSKTKTVTLNALGRAQIN